MAYNPNTNITALNGIALLTGNGATGTGSMRVTISSDQTAYSVNAAQSGTWNIGTITTLPALVAGSAVIGKVSIDQTTPGTTNLVALAANQSINNAQINGVTPLMGNGITGTGSMRVTVASDNTPYAVKIDQTTPGTTNLVALAANQSVNVSQINAVTPLMGNGITGTGSPRVTVASDNTPFAVKIDQTTPGTTNAVVQTPATPTAFVLNSAATTNATSVKASAGTLYGITCSNNGAAAAFVKLYNKASAPTVGTDVPVIIIVVPITGTVSLNLGELGHRFATGIALATTNLMAEADATAVAASQIKIMADYI